jgi:hydrogenase maturation protease
VTELAGKILLLGYGNPGRLDDGLGPALADLIEQLHLPGVTVSADYQLTVEDAAAVAEHDVVIFADAAVAGTEPFYFHRLAPAETDLSFSSHSADPAAVLALAHRLFHAQTRAYVLGIRGYAFNEFGERLSDAARANLAAAIEFLRQALHTGRFVEVGTGPDAVQGCTDERSFGDRRCKLANT